MERCVASARRIGIFKEFHVFTDAAIPDCNCYDIHALDTSEGLFKLVYLKAGVSKLLFDYFVWVDADSWFVRPPRDLLEPLQGSPIHVPLTANLSHLNQDAMLEKCTIQQYVDVMRTAGINDDVYKATAAFWIVHRDAIDHVCELAHHIRTTARKCGLSLNIDAFLGYTMQMLCANPELHRVPRSPLVWAGDDLGIFKDRDPDNQPWTLIDPLSGENCIVNPSLVHLPKLKGFKTSQTYPLNKSPAEAASGA